MKNVRNKIHKVIHNDKLFDAFNYIILTLLLLCVLYPVIYVISSSFSTGTAVASGKVKLFPVDFNLSAYKEVLYYKEIWIGYANTIFYTVSYTLLGLAVCTLAAYALSRKAMPLRGFFSFLFAFTMWFGGGTIPTYLLIRDLGMLNTRWAVILPSVMGVYNMIILRTSFEKGIPGELYDAAKVDGCGELNCLLKIVLPLSKATLAVIAMFYAVGMWNSYMGAFLYLEDRSKMPLQVFLREILVMNQNLASEKLSTIGTMVDMTEIKNRYEVIKYVVIVIATLPLAVVYPFLQRYFAKGVMLGSVKG